MLAAAPGALPPAAPGALAQPALPGCLRHRQVFAVPGVPPASAACTLCQASPLGCGTCKIRCFTVMVTVTKRIARHRVASVVGTGSKVARPGETLRLSLRLEVS